MFESYEGNGDEAVRLLRLALSHGEQIESDRCEILCRLAGLTNDLALAREAVEIADPRHKGEALETLARIEPDSEAALAHFRAAIALTEQESGVRCSDALEQLWRFGRFLLGRDGCLEEAIESLTALAERSLKNREVHPGERPVPSVAIRARRDLLREPRQPVVP